MELSARFTEEGSRVEIAGLRTSSAMPVDTGVPNQSETHMLDTQLRLSPTCSNKTAYIGRRSPGSSSPSCPSLQNNPGLRTQAADDLAEPPPWLPLLGLDGHIVQNRPQAMTDELEVPRKRLS